MQFKVEVGTPDYRAGDTITVEAEDVDAARAAAERDDMVVSNGFVVHAVYQLMSGTPAQTIDMVAAALPPTQPMELPDSPPSH